MGQNVAGRSCQLYTPYELAQSLVLLDNSIDTNWAAEGDASCWQQYSPPKIPSWQSGEASSWRD